MTKEVYIEQFERRLTELSFPSRLLRRKAEELSDHYDFLHRTTLKEGKSESEAGAYARQELGNPVELAEQAVIDRKQACWWGRHPILGYVIIPIISLAPAFTLTILAIWGYVAMRKEHFIALSQNSSSFKELRSLLMLLYNSTHYLAVTLVPLPFCWMARRSARGLAWPTVTCVICAAQGMFLYPIITMRNPNLSYHWAPHLLGGIGPLLVALAGYWRQHLLLKRLQPLPAHLSRGKAGLAALSDLLTTPLGGQRPGASAKRSVAPPFDLGSSCKKALRTPTYWAVVAILLTLVSLVAWNNSKAEKRQAARVNKGASNAAWAAERAAVEDELRSRQAARDTTHETTIDLQPYINTQLSESTDGGAKGLAENSLGELPSGTHIYGGVPFDVQGRIQLMGKGLEQWKRMFPVAAKNIKIGRKCGKIYLFHGENCNMVAQVQGTVARLVLHYTDGSAQQVDINSGEHVLDWWGVTYTTGADKKRRFVTSPDSELAWTGKNPWIKKFQPQMSLRLYKSTFTNPQPDMEVAAIDYVSTMSYAAPFLVGLTVE